MLSNLVVEEHGINARNVRVEEIHYVYAHQIVICGANEFLTDGKVEHIRVGHFERSFRRWLESGQHFGHDKTLENQTCSTYS